MSEVEVRQVEVEFTGKERDAESGLDYFGARYFGSAQGRFTSPDPYNVVLQAKGDEFSAYLSQPQNWNKYAYTWNNPLRFVDPNGENVYVVTYTTGNDKGDEDFKKVAETMAKEIERSKNFNEDNDIVLVRGVKTKADLKGVLDEANSLGDVFGKVEQFSMVSHGGPGDGPIFEHGTPRQSQYLDRDEVSALHVNWSSTASASFFACRSSYAWAQDFADRQGVRTGGLDGFGRIVDERNGTWPLNKLWVVGGYIPNLYMESTGPRGPGPVWFTPRRRQ